MMIRVFPRRTKWTPNDELAFVGDPPLFRPEDRKTPIMISVTFTWDIEEGERLRKAWGNFYDAVFVGGPAIGDYHTALFVAGRFVKEGVTLTSRGCPWKCPWCFVPKREGEILELERIEPGWIVQDNNLLACSKEHQKKVFEMLREQRNPIEFSGGLDGHFLSNWHIDWFKKLRVGQFWFACDHPGALKRLEKIADFMADFSEKKKRCYVMIGYDGELIHEAEARLEKVYSMGFLPFSQLYQGEEWIEYSKEWKKLNRKWSRPAAYRKRHSRKPRGEDFS
jgi:hypothetical protein